MKCIVDYQGDVNINLGAGTAPLEGYINVDLYTPKYADVIADLEKPLPFDDGFADLIIADNVFEHIKNILDLNRECLRILKPGGVLAVRVPYFKSKFAFVDPTHVNFYTLNSYDYFISNTYNHEKYKFFEESFSKMEILVNDNFGIWKLKAFRKLVYRYSDILENSVLFRFLFKIKSITFILTK